MFLTLVFFRNPVIFLRAMWHLLRCTAKPGFHEAYLCGRQWLKESEEHGLCVSLATGVASAYSAAHVRARIELYEASRETALGLTGRAKWRRVFGPVSPGPNQLRKLADIANALTGCLLPKTALARAANWLVLPRYLYCLCVVLASAFRSGLLGNESRIFLASLVMFFLAFITIDFFRWYYLEGLGP